ncbi:inner membrane protein YhjD [Rhodococcus spelaei]|uniref:Inner membrane protein YhjD n=1 Tax=Rhodococcus spelaei TaxID=2546320 RepID=A0A541B0Y9_9NOCA|nr:inner membrane protein YhjD [Rhodococcus spelaei]TQF65981.1 inner membrane protein YhjD [Rhodococcus spelaei]
MPDVKSFLERQRAARPWLDHLIRAGGRYQQQKGDYFAAGITYFSVFALFPMLMVAFAVTGFILVGHPELVTSIHDSVSKAMPGDLGTQINQLIDAAIDARTTVGVLGLLGAAYSGLGWMANLREALSAMWEQRHPKSSFLRTKLLDLTKLVGLLLAVVLAVGLSVLADGGVIRTVLEWLTIDDIAWVQTLVQVMTSVLALAATWAVFVWVIARLPREPITLRSAARAALFAAIGFAVFTRLGAIYLRAVTGGPAGSTFGPIIGLLVFIYFTARLILFSTAWAATARENISRAYVPPPDPAVIEVVAPPPKGPSVAEAIALVGAGAVAALGLGGMFRRRRDRR